MAYFGGSGVRGHIHPSLKAYIDCFDSKPFPRFFPRGGGIWEQDPMLMLHFRAIREYELKWRNAQAELRAQQDNRDPGPTESAGPSGIEAALDEYISQLEGDDAF